jgi:enamine deaminase RidA (YjgF/YER057c/UK114 family)
MTETMNTQNKTTASCFLSTTGVSEHFVVLQSSTGLSIAEALAELDLRYHITLEEQGLSPESARFTRFYLSDIENQLEVLRNSRLFASVSCGAVSVIQQRPLSGAQCAMVSYHMTGERTSIRLVDVAAGGQAGSHACLLTTPNHRFLWSGGLCAGPALETGLQTTRVFTVLAQTLERHGMSVPRNLLRTWIYVHDIDNHYQDMVVARRQFFEQQGLKMGSRYPASTGIEGVGAPHDAMVAVDALAIDGLVPEQIERMEALSHLPPTIRYGVTFERGLTVRYGDRSHIYLSGTASIGPDGAILHASDPRKQTARALENAAALLATKTAELSDMNYLLLYLRNPSDLAQVLPVIREQVPDHIPILATHAAVCRPGWLVELEGEAVVAGATRFAPL